MSDVLTGDINNGSIGDAAIGTFKGSVGTVTLAGDKSIKQLAFRGDLQGRRPTSGKLDGQQIEVVDLRRSDVDRRLMIATFRLQSA